MRARVFTGDQAEAEARDAIRQAYLAGRLDEDAATIALLTLDAEACGIYPARPLTGASATPHPAARRTPTAS